jgi:hypothetical protein
MKRKKRKATTDAVEILHRRYYRGKPLGLAALERARADDHVARKIPLSGGRLGSANGSWLN